MNWNNLQLRMRALLFRRRAEKDLEEELEFHIAMETRKHLGSGMAAADARRTANVRFGGLDRVKEECRDVRGLRLIETTLQDIRYAVSGFRRTPGFALTVVATIALGLSLNTTLFTVFNAYVLQPLEVRDPYRLYQFTWANRNGDGHRFSWREFQEFQAQNPAFSEVAAINRISFARVEGHLMLGQLVTGNYFAMLGVAAMRGRTLLPEDAEVPGSAPVAVLSSSAWINKFARDADIIGKRIVIHGHALEVVGVAQAGFRGMSEVPLDYWVPVTLAPQLEEGDSLFAREQPERLTMIGRLREDVTLRRAQSVLTAWALTHTARRPGPEQATRAILRSRATIVPLDPVVVAAASPVIFAFGLVLLIACANVANMMLARAMARQREIGVRLAMGAGRSRLIRQLLTESMALALPAAAVAFLVSRESLRWGERLIVSTLPSGYLDFFALVPLQPDARVFCFMLAAGLLSALLFGLAPAIQATRGNVMQAARGEFTTDFRPARLRNALVIGQVSVSVLLLICAAALLRANNRLQKLDVGLRTGGVLELDIQDRFRAQVLQQLAAEPGVQSTAAASKAPMTGHLPRVPIVVGNGSERFPAGYLYASPEYFQIFGLHIMRGRNFTREEATAGEAVAIVSEATAARFWPGQEALGRSFRMAPDPRQPRSLADAKAGAPPYSSVLVIGIASDAVNGWVGDGRDQTCIYFPTTASKAGNVLFVRANGDVEATRRKLDAALTVSAPGAVEQIHPMDEVLAAQLYPFRALYWISSAVGGLALLLTLAGIHGVLFYVVTQRTKEIGIRMALGARPAAVARLVLGQSLRFALVGAAIGGMGALGALRMAAWLADMKMFVSIDGTAFALALPLVISASAAAAWFPARRAARASSPRSRSDAIEPGAYFASAGKSRYSMFRSPPTVEYVDTPKGTDKSI